MVDCGIAPSEVPQLTRLQINTLIYQHNKRVRAEQRERKKQQARMKRR